eukprot:3931930-Rhodomonas_salina.3
MSRSFDLLGQALAFSSPFFSAARSLRKSEVALRLSSMWRVRPLGFQAETKNTLQVLSNGGSGKPTGAALGVSARSLFPRSLAEFTSPSAFRQSRAGRLFGSDTRKWRCPANFLRSSSPTLGA